MTPEARWERKEDRADALELEVERLQFEIWGEARAVGLGDDEEYYLEFCPSSRATVLAQKLEELSSVKVY